MPSQREARSHIYCVLQSVEICLKKSARSSNIEVWSEAPDMSENRIAVRRYAEQSKRWTMLRMRRLDHFRLLKYCT